MRYCISGWNRRRRQNFVCPLGLLCHERTHHGFHLQRGPPFHGSILEHSILLSLSVSFLFLVFDYSHTALHCPVVLFSSISGDQEIRDGEREEDSILFFKATVANSYTTCIHITLEFLSGK